LIGIILAALIVAAPAAAQGAPARSRSDRRAQTSCRVVRRTKTHKLVRVCKRKAAPTSRSTAPADPASVAPTAPEGTTSTVPAPTAQAAPTTPAAPSTTPTPPTSTPPTGNPVPAEGETELHATIGTGFSQNPLVPDEVTWRFSASATRTVDSEGEPRTEEVALPSGELAFFVDGKLECEIHAIGAIDGSTCTTIVKKLGAHEVEAIFTTGEQSDTTTRIDYLNKVPTKTSLEVSIEPTAPEYIEVGTALDGYPEMGFEVGRVRISGAVDPGGYPTLSCEGQPVGCLIPEVSLRNRGSATVPLYAQHRRNPVTEREEWHVAFDAYQPSLRKEGRFWQFPNESVGAYFFHAVAEPEPSLYEPSSTTLPLNLNGGHYPFFRQFVTGEDMGGPVQAVEGSPTPVMTIGTYEKVNGLEGSLPLRGSLNGPRAELEGCGYYVTVDGKTDNERRTASAGHVEILGAFGAKTAVPAGVHTIGLAVEREKGAGPGTCTLTSGYVEAYERLN
jgi:hypothetical protein